MPARNVRRFGGLGALENLVDMSGHTTEELRNVCPVAHEATGLHSLPENIHGR